MKISDAGVAELILKELRELRSEVAALRVMSVDTSIETYSLNQVCKKLKKGSETIKKLVAQGDLEAIETRVGNAVKLSFRVCDVRAFQERGKGNVVVRVKRRSERFDAIWMKALEKVSGGGNS